MTDRATQYEKIFCDEVRYRKGIISLSVNIHPLLVNLEVCEVGLDTDLAGANNVDFDLEGLVTSSTEVELSLLQAKKLSEQLQNAISTIEDGSKEQT